MNISRRTRRAGVVAAGAVIIAGLQVPAHADGIGDAIKAAIPAPVAPVPVEEAEGNLRMLPTVISSTPVIGGVASLPDGRPAAGATINLFDLAQQVPDGTTAAVPLATAQTDALGRYSLALPVTLARAQKAIQNGGATNMRMTAAYAEVPETPDLPAPVVGALDTATPVTAAVNPWLSEGGDSVGVYAFVREFAVRWLELSNPLTGACGYKSAGACFDDLVDTPDSLVSTTLQYPDIVAVTLESTLPSAPQQTVVDGAATPLSMSDCTTMVTKVGDSDTYTKIGEYHTYIDMDGHFDYGETADSDIGGAVKIGSKDWEASGSHHVGNGSGSKVNINRGAYYGHQLTSSFHYVQERLDTYCTAYHRSDYVIRATRWNGGIAESNDVSGWDGSSQYYKYKQKGYNSDFAPNSGFSRSKNQSWTYSGAASVFGVGLDAKSGYSRNVDMYWNFRAGNYTHSLFGHDGPATTAKIVYAY